MCYFPYCCDKILHRSDLSKKFALAHGLESTVPYGGRRHSSRAAPWEVVWSDRTALNRKRRAGQEVVWSDRKWCGVTGQSQHRI